MNRGEQVSIVYRVPLLLLACVAMLAACRMLPEPAPAQVVAGAKRELPGRHYVVDEQKSDIRLRVFRDGPLARLGHNHVITGRLRGVLGVAETDGASGFRLEIPLDSFSVDLPAARQAEGEPFSASVPDSAREGTRANMLGAALLDAAHFPVISIESESLAGDRQQLQASAKVTVRGRESLVQFPAVVREVEEGIFVTASFSVLQTALGLEPFSILGGALRVQDEVEVRINLLARKPAN